MRKIKILAFLLTFNLFCANYVFAKSEDLKQTKTNESKIEKDSEIECNITEKEKEKYYVKGYKITQIVKKDIFKIVCYEHEISGAKFLIFFENGRYLKIDPKVNPYSNGIFFIKCNPGISFVTLTAFCNFLNESLEQDLKFDYSSEELKELGLYNNEYFSVASEYGKGCGLFLRFKRYDKKLFKNIFNILCRPRWLRFKKFLNLSLQQTKNFFEFNKNMNRQTYGFDLEPKMYDRFCFGSFTNYGEVDELEKLRQNEDFLMNKHDQIFNPLNFLIQINGKQNPNYKEIMKDISEHNYFKFRDRKEEEKINEKKSKNFIAKDPYREIELSGKSVMPYTQNSKKYKYKARLFWDISKIPEQERNVFLTRPEVFEDFLDKEIKKMGYSEVKAIERFHCASRDYDSIVFDGLYYIDLFGSNKRDFEKEKLEENGQKLIKMLYEKISNVSDEELLSLVYYDLGCIPEFEDKLNFGNSTKYSATTFENLYLTLYCLTNNPFNKKYYNFKNDRKIEYKTKDVLDSFKKYKNHFELLYNNKPNYIDFFIANGESKNRKDGFVNYLSPIYENFVSSEKNKKTLKDNLLALFNYEIIFNKFYKPNLIDKNLIRKSGDNDVFFSIKPENLAEVENYIFKKFKTEIKNYIPDKNEVEKIKSDNIKNLNLKTKYSTKTIKEYEDILNNKEKFNQYLKISKEARIESHKRAIVLMKYDKKRIEKLENEKVLNKQEKEYMKNLIKSQKSILKTTKKSIKQFKEDVKNPNCFSDEAKKQINDKIKWEKQKIKQISESIECIKNLTYEDFVNFYKNLKFSSSYHLKLDKECTY